MAFGKPSSSLVAIALLLTSCPGSGPRPLDTPPPPETPQTFTPIPPRVTSTPTPQKPKREVSMAEFTTTGLIVAMSDGGLFRSRDLGRTWIDITPVVRGKPGYDYSVMDVEFRDGKHGWAVVAGCCEDAGDLFVLRTGNAGRTWRQTAVKDHLGHHAGSGMNLSFSSTNDGWLSNWDPVAEGTNLWRTTNGGRSWTQLVMGDPRPPPGPAAFVSRNHGWVGSSFFRTPSMSEIRDGRRWFERSLSIPVGYSSDAQFDRPRVFGNDVVVARYLRQGSRVDLALYRSQDQGLHWRRAGILRGVAGSEDGLLSMAPDVQVVPASASTWWVFQPLNRPSVWRTTNAGRTWHRSVTRGLPSIQPTGYWAEFSVKNALVAVGLVPTATGLVLTRDGGATWKALRLPKA